MKFTTEVSLLRSPIGIANDVIPTRSPLLSLEYIQIVASKDGVGFFTTDLELDSLVTIKTKVKAEGRALVNSKRLNDIIQALPDGAVTFELKDKLLTIKCENSKTSLPILPDGEIPELRKDFKADDSFAIVAGDLIESIRSTIFAVNTAKFGDAMSGVLFDIKKNTITMVATEGHKFSLFAQKCKIKSEHKITCPVKTLNLILKYFSVEDEIKVSYSAVQMMFETDKISLCTKLIDIPYPDYEAVIPKENNILTLIVRKDLMSAVKRSMIFSDREDKHIIMSFTKGSVLIRNAGSDLGAHEESVKCDYDAEDLKIGFGATYLYECLDRLTTDVVQFKLNDKPRGGKLIYPYGEVTNNQFMLVMPFRIDAND